MVHLAVTLISTLLAATGLVAGAGIPPAESALDPIPAGTPDGFYVGRLAENGSTIWEFLGHDGATINPAGFVANSSALAAASALPESTEGLVKRDTTYCAGYGTVANQVNVAQGMLADMCGNGYYFTGRSIARVYADSVAYGCNYASSQTCTHNDLWLYFGFINSRCGFEADRNAGAGWYRIDRSKAAYGRTTTGSGFC